MFLQIILLILGLGVLILGAEWLVSGATRLARRYNVSDLAIGLTIVAFGTSAPELVVNLFASLTDHQDIFFGNILGSNNFNIFVVLGVSGLILPLKVQSSTIWKEIPFSLAAALLFYLMANDFHSTDQLLLGRIDGFILLTMFIFFQYYVYRQIRSDQPENFSVKTDISLVKVILMIVLGLAGLVIGGKLVMDNAVSLAKLLGVSEKIIGLTIVAAGTSLPELATSAVAAFRKNADIAVGNIIGSNIFNIFLIGGIISLVKPVRYNTSFNNDFYMLGAGTMILFITMFIMKKRQLGRWEAALLLLLYTAYTVFLISGEV